MPPKRSRDVPAIPDITEDPVERKRVLSMLAQRRYRERKRKQWDALQAQVDRRKDSNNGYTETRNSLATPEDAHTTLNTSGSLATDFPVAMDRLPLDCGGLGDYCPDLMVETVGRTSLEIPVVAPSMDLLPDSLSPSQLLALSQSGQFPSVATQDMSLFAFPASQGPFLTSSLPDLILPYQPEGNIPHMLQLANVSENNSSLSEQLQEYQTSTFSFPDDHHLEIPSLKLLNAAMKVAERLNMAEMLWDLSAVSPFYRAATGPHSVSTPPSLVSSSSSPSSITSHTDDHGGDTIELPRHLQPTTSQRFIPHHPILDLIPWPNTRDKLIQVFNLPPAMRPKPAQDPIGLLRLVYDMEDVGGEGIRVQGGDAFTVNAWEIGQTIFERWWWAFDRDIVERSDYARSLRGEKPLRIGESEPTV
ncbi:uncharacterized protein ACLA_067210 [Aspergillus clavatus NRRL 1]|uniref:BZIP domain-containing protein n=1 Tax=Aspergillus clavatus (strain ATCC 1007 / CBS 513.65 / DSM 816 / NCTC 3887 / NRRL 1 / QM 1276 / 107) TaxID=344612 RepID=A1CGK5_ASPCL|nr:uncharacterized protein ACLA_067210 [Aspergillus clavatus NRRL 1]EAW11085.1 conserved hypothetical protein [Aspergillus clavatus NRRL 1]